MNAKTREQIKDFVSDIDEYVPGLLASVVSEKFHVTYEEALNIICPPRPVARPEKGTECHYCGLPAVAYGFFGEPICHECGG